MQKRTRLEQFCTEICTTSIDRLMAVLRKLGALGAPRSVAELDPRTLRDIGIRHSDLPARGERVLHEI